MTHILISYKDNPSFSLYTTKLSREGEKKLNNKNWIGFNANGEEQFYTNSYSVSHILIQNCSQDEFNAAMTSHPIQYRIVEDNELTVNPNLFFVSTKLRLDINKVLARDTYTLKAASETVMKNSYDEKLQQSASALVSMTMKKSNEQQTPNTTPALSQSHAAAMPAKI